jgi:hypothetical protein
MTQGDDIAAAVGGAITSVTCYITIGKVAETAILAGVGGIVGMFAKKSVEWAWSWLKKKCKK